MIDPDTVEVDRTVPSIERIMRGLAIIRKYTEEKYMAAEHDIIYFGSYDDTLALMTEEDQRTMFACGWVKSEDAWAFFV